MDLLPCLPPSERQRQSGYHTCGFLFITDQKVAAYNRKRGVQKRQWKLPDTSRLRPLDAVAIDYLLRRCKAKWMMAIKNTDFILSLYAKANLN